MRNCRSGGEYYYIFLVTHKSRQKPSHHFKFTLKPGYLQDICGTVTGFCEFCRTRFSLVVRKQQKTPWTLLCLKCVSDSSVKIFCHSFYLCTLHLNVLPNSDICLQTTYNVKLCVYSLLTAFFSLYTSCITTSLQQKYALNDFI